MSARPPPRDQTRLDAFAERATAAPRGRSERPAPAPEATPRPLRAETAPASNGGGSAVPRVTQERKLRRLIEEGLEAVGFKRPVLGLRIHDYSGLRGSLERATGGAVRAGETLTMDVADGFLEAPDQAIRGLAASLGSRVVPRRHKVPELARLLAEYYAAWQRSSEARTIHSRLRKERARKQGRGPRGEAYDLDGLTRRLVDHFLGGRLKPVTVTWSSRAGYRTLGHHDADLDTIVVSRALDHPAVPEKVVAYVLYHELLHHVMGILEGPSDQRRVHPPAFRRREQRFPHWALCDDYLSELCDRGRPVAYAKAKAAWRVLWDEPWDKEP